MQKFIFILFLSFSIQRVCADDNSLVFPKEYGFLVPRIQFGMWPGIFVDLLYILNNAQSEQNALSEQEVTDLAFINLSKNYPFLKTSSLMHAEKKYLKIENLTDHIPYYEVMFDGNSEDPFSLEGKRNIDPYYIIVLMDKSTWQIESMTMDEHVSRKHSRCSYTKIGKTWSRKECK